ncbi:MAG: NAD-glutamate dehydrogenase [Sporichthyaceae bacterium]
MPVPINDAGQFARLREAYWKHVAAEELADRKPEDLDGAVRSHLELAENRAQGTARVRVFTPLTDTHGWSAQGRTVVEVVTDDMPFLVDSVTAELTRTDRAIDLVVHPQPVVRRDIVGRLLGAADPAAPSHEDTRESWIHVEVERLVDSEAEGICADLRRVLGDVRDAVEDWQKMGEAALRAADDLLGGNMPGRGTEPELAETWHLLHWLADNHFTFLGHREYRLESGPDRPELRGVPGSGLGILRGDSGLSASFDALPAAARARAHDRRPLIVTKSTSRSTVHRPGYLDFIGVKRFDAAGKVIGERRFLGLFSRSAYSESVLRIPVLRAKVDQLFELTGFAPASYSGRDLLEAVETYPRDELFDTEVAELAEILLAVLHLKERRRLRLFLRPDEYGRYVSALVYLPRDRYNTETRLRIQEVLSRELHGVNVEHTSRVTESVLARLHFIVRVDPDLPAEQRRPIDAAALEAQLVEATRTWREDLAAALDERYDARTAAELTARYAEAFPAGYREANSARAAVDDLTRIEKLPADSGLSVRLYQPRGVETDLPRFTIYRRGEAMSLSEIMPVLAHFGVEVTDEQPYRIDVDGVAPTWIYDFGLRTDPGTDSVASIREAFEGATMAVRAGVAESDGLHRLVLRAGLTWSQIAVLRAYTKYLRQAGIAFSQEYIENVLTADADIARMLVRLFEARFDPALGAADAPERVEVVEALQSDIRAALDSVASLDADRILRSLLTLIQATLRTNHWVPGVGTDPRRALAFKLDPQRIPDLPAPRPAFEIWVYSPDVEGVHLRFGPVARGGLRWSDRREDFRTEILGLVKAQMVKNSVIVPVGAKGGFVVKRPPAPTGSATVTPTDADRDAYAAEGVVCYRSFINALLDVTDNLINRQAIPAPHVVRHDPDDSYLVVAADKGTARFSDIANEISLARGFWLGDAFASGGSVGYDHKAMGITARGAWESVKRHFRERGIDCQAEDFTCVGVGDMSGDVFGNGMLLSRHIRLVAAFDHRHIFLDPTPDAATSFVERERMFALPRSSWANYDASLISAGGGVHPRSAKSIPITPEVRTALGLAEDTTALTPAELMRAILLAPVDLLWNGGIGTYVKASTETNAECGDKANDAIRVDGAALRAACVGEGGNLGCTQRGRIEYARAGGRINTDAIDNSAGVDTSDHEVNIKILLDAAVVGGDLDPGERTTLLASMTDEVAALVLRDNYAQNVALSNSVAQAPALLHAHRRLIVALGAEGLLDREVEFLPNEAELNNRAAAGLGLTGPELAVVLAWTKIALDREVLASDLPESPALVDDLAKYFPTALRERFSARIASHPLHREILTTSVVNEVVNEAGITFVHRVREETAATAVDIVRAWLVARDVFALDGFRADVAALDNVVSADVQRQLRLGARRLAERATRWLLQKRRPPLDIDGELWVFAGPVAEVISSIPALVRGSDAAALTEARASLRAAGVPAEVADRAAAMDVAFAALDIVEVARTGGFSPAEVAEVYFLLGDRLGIADLLSRINALPRDDRWKSMARASLREDLFAAHASLTADVLAAGSGDAESRLAAWRQAAAGSVERAERMFGELLAGGTEDLATVSVAMRTFRGLLSAPRS